ncbi:MAG: carbohydrate kinase family protein [Promethearchaeota archaeon]|nr:MAG: carbohydrate kinase family protein [Candidatus Lokiarchaeota archaeon]
MNYDIISVGIISLDIILTIPFFPEINSECFCKDIYKYHGGAAANFASFSSFYGGLRVGLMSAIGSDNIGKKLVRRMSEYNVCTRGVKKIENLESSQIFTLQIPNGNHKFIVDLNAFDKIDTIDLPKDYIFNSKLFYIAPGTAKIHEEIIKFAFKNKKQIGFNPGSVYMEQESKKNLINLLKFVDFLFINENEALFYSNENNIKDAGIKFLNFGVKHVLITQGEKGSSVFFKNNHKFFPGYKLKRKGVYGAGDAFAAGFLSDFLKTGNIDSAMENGNIFGAYQVKTLEMRGENPDKNKFLYFYKKMHNEQ